MSLKQLGVKHIAVIALLLGITMLLACGYKATTRMLVAKDQSSVASPEMALKTARAFLEEKKIDISRHDMSKPEDIQELIIKSQRAWRVSWKLNEFTGKGGQLVVTVYESGKCEQGWGE